MRAAVASGKLSDEWPKNTIWLGGRWSQSNDRWQWDDGSEATGLGWAEGQPSAPRDDHESEPWLCFVITGEVHDSPPPFTFGIMCEEGDYSERAAEGEAFGIAGARRLLDTGAPPVMAAAGRSQFATDPAQRMAWVHAAPGLSCDQACTAAAPAGAGGRCVDGAWPGSASEFQEAVLRRPAAHAEACKVLEAGGNNYDPSSIADPVVRRCCWRGSSVVLVRAGSPTGRCGAIPPPQRRRFCPCSWDVGEGAGDKLVFS